jgi:hypothetical protein
MQKVTSRLFFMIGRVRFMSEFFNRQLLRSFLRLLIFGLVFLSVLTARPLIHEAKAEPMREFILSCSYGVLAGTLVGAATLAFSDKPGENLNKVARGASIGLYGGILLGLYVVYAVPGIDEDEIASSKWTAPPEPPRFLLSPLVTEQGLEGVSARLSLLKF